MNWILPVVIAFIGITYPALFAASTVTRSPAWRVKSRTDLLIAGLSAVLMLVLLHQFFSWWLVPVALWLVPVAIVAAGAAGAVLAWPTLEWLREGRSLRRTVAGASVNVVVVAAISWAALS